MSCDYTKSTKYTDIAFIYSQCAGPGGVKVTEFIADKMGLKQGGRLVDIGMYRGYQTCFLAKEYGVMAVGIDPGGREWGEHRPLIDHMMDNAAKLDVHHMVLGIETGVPDTKLPRDCFDYAYSTTTFEMLRGMWGTDKYIESLKEVHRILKPDGLFGLGEPMIKSVPLPEDMKDFVPSDWLKCFATIEDTSAAIKAAGFSILEADYACDAQLWWNEYARYNRFHFDEFEEKKTISLNQDRWLSYGYVIAQKTGVASAKYAVYFLKDLSQT